MLVLSRKLEESVVLRHGAVEIVVKVVGFSNVRGEKQVKIGFDAPPSVNVRRSEIPDRNPRG